MPRRTEFPAPPEAVTGLGLPLSSPSLHHPLVVPGPREDPKKPYIRDWATRVMRLVTSTPWGREYFGDEDIRHYNIDQSWYHIPYEVMATEFTLDEMLRAKTKCGIMSEVGERFEKDPLYTPLYKVPNSMWQYGRMADQDYGVIVRLYRGLSRFDFGVPGFRAYYDHTDYSCGSEGHARYGTETVVYNGKTYTPGLWLDGPFAYHIVKDDEKVLTVGFALSEKGVMVSQVQVRGKKTGNRWLYKLGRGVREHVIDRVRVAWPDFPVHLITGATQKAYSKYTHRSKPETYPDAIADRVAAFYDAPLDGYGSGAVVNTGAGWGPCREFRELVPAAPARRGRAEPELVPA